MSTSTSTEAVRDRRIATVDQELAWLLIAATVPVGVAGLAMDHLFRGVPGKPVPAEVFLALTGRMSPEERSAAALRASLVALGVIAAFAVFGQRILDYLHVSLAALQGAGGLLLLLVALQLLTGQESEAMADAGEIDSLSDLPMLRAVGHPVAVNPDGPLARIARQEGWDVLRFDRLGGRLKMLGGLAAATLLGAAGRSVAVRRVGARLRP